MNKMKFGGRNCGKRKQRKNYGGYLPDILDLCAVRGGLPVPWAEAGKNGEWKTTGWP